MRSNSTNSDVHGQQMAGHYVKGIAARAQAIAERAKSRSLSQHGRLASASAAPEDNRDADIAETAELIEKLAYQVYREMMRLIELNRLRTGDPYP